jgi:hypothetical protein
MIRILKLARYLSHRNKIKYMLRILKSDYCNYLDL